MAGLKVDERFCMGCHACEVACKQEHTLPEGPRLIRVDLVPSRGDGTVPTGLWRVSVCRHCEEPACAEACPEAALDTDDGVVRVLPEACTGCRECADACPFGAPQFHPRTGVLLLCDLCPGRTESWGRPACVHHCPAAVLEL